MTRWLGLVSLAMLQLWIPPSASAQRRLDCEALFIERMAKPLGLADTRIALGEDLQSRLAAGRDMGGSPVANWDIPTLAGPGLSAYVPPLRRVSVPALPSSASARSEHRRRRSAPRTRGPHWRRRHHRAAP